jgi:hypothetical protein
MMKRIVVLVVFLLSAFTVLSAQSGNYQAFPGTVTDAGGTVNPNATVVMVNQDPKAGRIATSNADGNYISETQNGFPNLETEWKTLCRSNT